MIIVKHIDDALYFPLDVQPVSGSELTLELYSELSLTTLTFEDLSGEVSDDFIILDLSEQAEDIPNGEYNATLYDADGIKISITLVRFDLEEGGSYEDEPEYVVYHDEMDGYITTKDMSDFQREVELLEEEIVIKDAIISGLQEQVDSVTATTINFNGTFTPTEGTLGWNSVDVQVKDYFYVEAVSASTVSFVRGDNAPEELPIAHLEYSINKGEWVDWDLEPVSLNVGDKMYIRGNNTTFNMNGFDGYGYKFLIAHPSKVKIGGRIVSLLDKTLQKTAIPDCCFTYLFLGQSSIIEIVGKDMFKGFTTVGNKGCLGMFQNVSATNAPDLPMTNLADNCYLAMFNGCTSLTSAPKLPATTLADYCYQQMFQDCHALTKAPELPATTLAENCYRQMFMKNYALTETPYLPATALTQGAYYSMFEKCYALSKVHCAAIDISASNCTRNWLLHTPNSGTFIKDINATGWTMDSSNGIPSGWTVLNDNVLLQSTAITSNGTYVPQSGAAFDQISVNVPTGITPSGELAISGNGTYNVTQYASASVNVPTGITPSGDLYITENNGPYNDHYDVTNKATVTVRVPFKPDWNNYVPTGSTAGWQIGFYLENIPSGTTLNVTIFETMEEYPNHVHLYWGDGHGVDLYQEGYGVTGHTYSSDTSGWLYVDGSYTVEGTVEIRDWGNLFDYCKAIYVNTAYGDDTLNFHFDYPTPIPSNSVGHYIGYDKSGYFNSYSGHSKFISDLGHVYHLFFSDRMY